MRIGVFVCHCGNNIKATVDAAYITERLRDDSSVVCSAEFPYLCAEGGQKLITEAIAEHNLTGVVICACSPRMHETTFRKAAAKAGLNPYRLEIANIREQCAWVHKNKEEATEKALSLAKAAIAKIKLSQPLFPGESRVTKRALVIGGGIAGIQAALDIAEAGFPVDLVEKSPSIGGKMAQLDKTFPTLDCSACILTPKMVDVASHEKINLHTYSEVEKVEGFVGSFTVTIRKKARSVDMTKCTGCGDCLAACPVKGKENRKAIYIPYAQAVPNVPAIDRESCLYFKNGKCKRCEKACQPKAIDFTQEDERITEGYGAIIAATGFEAIRLDAFGEYGYHANKDVITSLEFERIINASGPTGGKLVRPSDGSVPARISFIQCVGSRDATARGKPYCSKVCCMYTAKHAISAKEKHPEIDVEVFYIDVRTPGKNFEEFYRRAVEVYGVRYIKGQVGKVIGENGSLRIQAMDMLENGRYDAVTDLVVLAAAIEPSDSAKKVAQMLSSPIDANGFLSEAHPKLRPVESATAGIFLCGMCNGPKDIPETVAQASAAACKVIGLLVKDQLTTNPCTAKTDENNCSGCGLCAEVCPYGAVGVISHSTAVNAALCQGCGGCTVACPSGAMNLQGFSRAQIIAEVDALCG
ncbi:MAG: CoB--CoM heterodisulfide reductase iron-sulfur subunit A family protein [Defluviitaleaceae bacterium]|nr:CoB--CoM heterodisulfide reductase iron-sulfur subunit A family protein [Defluviitaleaceae bacterium]